MPSPTIIRGAVFEQSSFAVVARIVGVDQGAIVRADVATNTGIVLRIYDVTLSNATPDTLLASYNGDGTSSHTADSTLITTSAIANTLLTDGYWDVDATGYNFIHTIGDIDGTGGSHFTMKGGHTYRLEYSILANASSPFHGTVSVVVEVITKPLVGV